MVEQIDISLNEVEMLSLKAARGAGLPWGLAEDVGRSARWFAQHSVPWAESLVALLGVARNGRPPLAERTGLPFLTAAFVADGAADLVDAPAARFAGVDWPIW